MQMPPNVLKSFVQQYIESQDSPEVQFAWQGGEPTLLSIDYFKSIISLQKKFAKGKKVTNSIQTNGTLLTDGWCRFFKEHGFLVGLSIDGPREYHDKYRVKANGRPTFDTVMSGLELLKKYRVPFNILTVVNDHNARGPLDVYRFLKKVGDGHIQFIPAVERLPEEKAKSLGLGLDLPPLLKPTPHPPRLTPWSVSPEKLARFYITIFDEWVVNDVGRVFVQLFDVALGNWLGAGFGLCQFSPKCGMAVALEHNGDLYSCDHYVYPDHKLGNIMQTPLVELMALEAQQRFGDAKLDSLPGYCKACDVRQACHGDCPKHRFMQTPDGEPGLSYLCKAYKKTFRHMAPYLNIMAGLVRSQKPASEIMKIVSKQGLPGRHSPPGRNAPCPCGSGKKYKRCCGK